MTNNLVTGQVNVLMRQNANILSKDQTLNKLFNNHKRQNANKLKRFKTNKQMKNQQTPIRPTLHPYIPHLISDIQNAFRPKEKTPQRVMTFEEEMEEVENFVARPLGFQSFGSFCGLTREDFPPSVQLSDEDMKLVIAHYLKLLMTWNAAVSLNKEMPINFQYDLLVDILDEEFMYMEYGTVHFDFCSGDWDGCRLGEYCGCLEWK